VNFFERPGDRATLSSEEHPELPDAIGSRSCKTGILVRSAKGVASLVSSTVLSRRHSLEYQDVRAAHLRSLQ